MLAWACGCVGEVLSDGGSDLASCSEGERVTKRLPHVSHPLTRPEGEVLAGEVWPSTGSVDGRAGSCDC